MMSSDTIVIDGILRPMPRIALCKHCGRAPTVGTGYTRKDGTLMNPDGIGPYLICCDHGGTEWPESTRFEYRQAGGTTVIRPQTEALCPVFYRSWYFGRAVREWNQMNDRPAGRWAVYAWLDGAQHRIRYRRLSGARDHARNLINRGIVATVRRWRTA